MVEASPLSPLAQVGPSMSEEVPTESEDLIKMVMKVKPAASIFKNKRLVERLLNMILLPWDHEELTN